MFFEYCYKKKIKTRVANAFYHIFDFSLVYTLPEHPRRISHSKLTTYFEDRYTNAHCFFGGGSFKDDEAYHQVLSDLKLGRDLVMLEGWPLSLARILHDLVDDIEMMKDDA